MSAIELSENKVFIAFGNSNECLSGKVILIDGTNIIQGDSIQLSSESYSRQAVSVVTLSKDRVFVSYSCGRSHHLYGMICEVDGTNILSIANTLLDDKNLNEISAKSISENKVFIAYSNSSYLYSTICTINDNEILLSKIYTINSGGTIHNISLTLADKNTFVVAYTCYSYEYPYATVCKVKEDSIEHGTHFQVDNLKMQKLYATKLSTNKLLLAGITTGSAINCYVLLTANKSVVAQNSTAEIITGVSPLGLSTIALNENTALLYYRKKTPENSNLAMIEISENTIIVQSDTELIEQATRDSIPINIFAKNEYKIYLVYSTLTNIGVNLYSQDREFEIGKVDNFYDSIYGIAKTKATDGQTLQIYVPNIN